MRKTVIFFTVVLGAISSFVHSSEMSAHFWSKDSFTIGQLEQCSSNELNSIEIGLLRENSLREQMLLDSVIKCDCINFCPPCVIQAKKIPTSLSIFVCAIGACAAPFCADPCWAIAPASCCAAAPHLIMQEYFLPTFSTNPTTEKNLALIKSVRESQGFKSKNVQLAAMQSCSEELTRIRINRDLLKNNLIKRELDGIPIKRK